MTVDDDQPRTSEGESIWRAPYATVTVANLTVVALVAFDGLAIVAALPSITDDLGDVALVPWVITGFLATYGVDEPAGCYDDLDECDVLIKILLQ